MTRPLTCADRLPKQGDLLARTPDHAGYYAFLLPYEDWWRVWKVDEMGGWAYWCLEEIRRFDATWIEWTETIRLYRYLSRADGGPVDWPIDAGAYV